MTEKERRNFIKSSGIYMAVCMLLFNIVKPEKVNRISDIIKVGLIGCGGRGTGAAVQALHADGNVHLTAMGNIFAD